MSLALPQDWLERLALRRDEPALEPREPLWAGGSQIGSVAPGFFPQLKLPFWLLLERGTGWELQGDVTESLAAIALAMREKGLAHAWRDEQLAVTDGQGRILGTIERAAVRPLGITTFAVHLAGVAPDGRHWVQQRSFTKANDPGMWDTLMGGMIPAGESLESALARETWEEAGLRMGQLRELRHGGRLLTRRPSRDDAMGYVVEWIDWYRSVVPEGVEPRNQDGEAERFELLDPEEVTRKLLGDEFTLEAAVVLSESAR